MIPQKISDQEAVVVLRNVSQLGNHLSKSMLEATRLRYLATQHRDRVKGQETVRGLVLGLQEALERAKVIDDNLNTIKILS